MIFPTERADGDGEVSLPPPSDSDERPGADRNDEAEGMKVGLEEEWRRGEGREIESRVSSERELCDDAEALGLGSGRVEALEREEGGLGRAEEVEGGGKGEGVDQSSAVPPSGFESRRDALVGIGGEDDGFGRGSEGDGMEEEASWEEPPDIE